MGIGKSDVAFRLVIFLGLCAVTTLICSCAIEHYATLEATLEQSTDSTKLTLSLKGVPTGMEDEIKRNLEGY